MDRSFYLNLAATGLRMPIGAHLVLHEQADPAAVVRDGRALGEVIVQTARRFHTPLALPLMDLTIEKAELVRLLGGEASSADTFHFHHAPSEAQIERFEQGLAGGVSDTMAIGLRAIEHVSRERDLTPVGMVIGPFSLMTKLLADPITPVYLAGEGAAGESEADVATMLRALEMSLKIVMRSVRMQARAGARAVCVCEPAANTVFISPKQMASGSDVFQRLVMAPNLALRKVMADAGVDLIFHDCGELNPAMVRQITELDASILSLGSSRRLWEDAALVPRSTVLFGNLPSKRFYSDSEISVAQVAAMADELMQRMRDTGYPFVLGSECDVLSVPGCHESIMSKVRAMMDSGR